MATTETPPAIAGVELTTVADDAATFHLRGADGAVAVEHVGGLAPDTEYERHGVTLRTLARPSGPLRCRIGTVNDVHFGEVEAGRIDHHTDGPIMRVPADADPYPETMNRAAVAEMSAAALDRVIVKGDVTTSAADEEFAAFEATYRAAFDGRLDVVRGNHDAVEGRTAYSGDTWIDLPGVAVALLDTVIPDAPNGTLRATQLDWLDAGAAASTVPVIVMGHHQQWVEGERNPEYFGIDPDASDALSAVLARRASIVAYTAGHTHRHRVRLVAGGVPSVEVGCVKDFPGTWAEYRVYDGGIVQIVHRVSSPEALAWSESCRGLYSDFGVDYARYALGRLTDRCFPIPLR
ncbi:MAG: metallophosphoesterase family protein [Actinomycetota bacterium]|nr:metallophosphoesterase family protein [Acidimicrobiia bacterium]MDQ3469363.1 metallophosphoesterase family protein [Actinomycetota bacterium]